MERPQDPRGGDRNKVRMHNVRVQGTCQYAAKAAKVLTPVVVLSPVQMTHVMPVYLWPMPGGLSLPNHYTIYQIWVTLATWFLYLESPNELPQNTRAPHGPRTGPTGAVVQHTAPVPCPHPEKARMSSSLCSDCVRGVRRGLPLLGVVEPPSGSCGFPKNPRSNIQNISAKWATADSS